MLGVFSPEFSPTCRIFDRQERTWRELSNLFRAYEFPGFALFWGCARRRKALRSLAFWLPLSSAKRILISGAFRGPQKTRNQVTGNRPWVRIPPAPPLLTRLKRRFQAGFRHFGEENCSSRKKFHRQHFSAILPPSGEKPGEKQERKRTPRKALSCLGFQRSLHSKPGN